jgi:hypothetical protein
MVTQPEIDALDAFAADHQASRSNAGRCLLREGLYTKVRPIMAHNSLPNGSRWPEADFATLDLSKGTPQNMVGSSRLVVPIEDDAIVRVYCDDGVSDATLIGRRWYWVDASEGDGQ